MILSSTISYALAEELDEGDLTLVLSFLGMISADLGLLISQKAIKKAIQSNTVDEDINIDTEVSEEDIIANVASRYKKVKVKKKKKKRHNV